MKISGSQVSWTPQAVIAALSLTSTVIIAVIGCAAWVVNSNAEVKTEVRSMRSEFAEYKAGALRDMERMESRVRDLERMKGN